MGFKHPLTTATGLDTGGDSPVVITEDVDGGVVEVYPDRSSSPGRLRARQDTVGGTTVLESPPNAIGQRTRLELTGLDDTSGNFAAALLSGPGRLDLNLEGGVEIFGQPIFPARHAWSFPRVSPGGLLADTFPGNNTYQVLMTGTIVDAPPGDFDVNVTLLMAGSVNAGGNMQLAINSVDVLGSPRSDVLTAAQPNTYLHQIENHPGGNLVFGVAQLLVAGTGTIFTRASGIRVNYLGPRS